MNSEYQTPHPDTRIYHPSLYVQTQSFASGTCDKQQTHINYQVTCTLVTDNLKNPLEDYINNQSKVRLLRADERSGLIRARLLGFESCTAPVAVFLDSHCEVTKGIVARRRYLIIICGCII